MFFGNKKEILEELRLQDESNTQNQIHTEKQDLTRNDLGDPDREVDNWKRILETRNKKSIDSFEERAVSFLTLQDGLQIPSLIEIGSLAWAKGFVWLWLLWFLFLSAVL